MTETVISAPDIILNGDTLGLGQPYSYSNPAIQNDVYPGAGVGSKGAPVYGYNDNSGTLHVNLNQPVSQSNSSGSGIGNFFSSLFGGGGTQVVQTTTPPSETGGPGSVSVDTGSASSVAGKVAEGALSGVAGTLGDWAIRATLIVLGFIFVAVGLSMFRGETHPIVDAAKRVTT